MSIAASFLVILLVAFLAVAAMRVYLGPNAQQGGETIGGVVGSFCTDSDKGSIYVQGTCISAKGSWTDKCNSDGTMTEYSCSKSKGNPQCQSASVTCPNGYACSSGACAQLSGGGISTTTTTATTTATTITTATTATTKVSTTTTTAITTQNAYTQHEKGLHISPDFLFQNLTMPALSELKQDNFTVIGTSAYDWYSSYRWNQVATWFKTVHNAGLRTMMRVSSNASESIILTRQAAANGADVVWYDEPMSQYNITQQQLLATLNAGLAANPRLQFFVTEYRSYNIANAYSWTANYSSVRVVTDDYYNKSIIDYEMQLAQAYNKRPAAWLIFTQGSQNFDCYVNLPTWTAYAAQRKVDAFFWYMDSTGIWQQKWQYAVSYPVSAT